VSQFAQPGEPRLSDRALLFGGAVAAAIGVVILWLAGRWRGLILLHLFFLTLWLAIQVFTAAGGAYTFLYNQVQRGVGYFRHIHYVKVPFPRLPHAKPAVNCWRDRSLDGDCFAQGERHRHFPPPRLRIPEPPPCHRFYMCGSDDI